MTDPQDTNKRIDSLAHSEGEPKGGTGHSTSENGNDNTGSDVGGPAQTSESATEDAVTGTSTVGEDDDPDDQGTHPL